jgi:hypothetical protein
VHAAQQQPLPLALHGKNRSWRRNWDCKFKPVQRIAAQRSSTTLHLLNAKDASDLRRIRLLSVGKKRLQQKRQRLAMFAPGWH